MTDITSIARGLLQKTVVLAANPVARFCYTATAYSEDDAAGVASYSASHEQNIPLQSYTDTDSAVLDSGFRATAASIPRMYMNHFIGRLSYNVNKTIDFLNTFYTGYLRDLAQNCNEYTSTTTYQTGDVCFQTITLDRTLRVYFFQYISGTAANNVPPISLSGTVDTANWTMLVTAADLSQASGVLPAANGGTGNTSGLAASAAKLATARTIGGVSFAGTENISLPGVNAEGNQNTSGNAATATKLAAARTIGITDADGTNSGTGIAFDGSADKTLKLPSTIKADKFYSSTKLLPFYTTIDLSSLPASNFYPVTFGADDTMLNCEIHSPNLIGTASYNQNVIHFQLIYNGASDTPRCFDVLQYGVFDSNEITIGCIGAGTTFGERCIWLRGGMLYRFYCNAIPTLHTSDYSYGSSSAEVYSVGTSFYGGTNANVTILWTPSDNAISFTGWHKGSLKIEGAVDVSGNVQGNVIGNSTTATGIAYGTCATPSDNNAKTVYTGSNIVSLIAGAQLSVKFMNDCSASGTCYKTSTTFPFTGSVVTGNFMTLNVNGLGARTIYIAGEPAGEGFFRAGEIHNFIYDGAQWVDVTADLIYKGHSSTYGYYEKKRNGKIEQYGRISATDNSPQTVYYPIKFSSFCTGTCFKSESGSSAYIERANFGLSSFTLGQDRFASIASAFLLNWVVFGD